VHANLVGRTVRICAQAVALTAVVSGSVAYAHTSKQVTLVLDGVSRQIRADAVTVRGVLSGEGVKVGDRDLVAPLPDSPVKDGDQIVVRFARPLTLTLDGAARTYWTTELTVDSALSSLGVRADGARMSASRSQPLGRTGLDVLVSTPKTVTIAADGRTRDVSTTAVTVSDLLREQSLVRRPQDQLSVLPSAPVVPGLVVALTRIDRRRLGVTEAIPASTVQRTNPDLAGGQRRVTTDGAPGTRTTVYEVVLANGKEVRRNVVSTSIGTQPVARVIEVGAKPQPRPSVGPSGGTGGGTGGGTRPSGGSVPGVDGLNWASLARCESGGNPKAVNPAGYYGLYQFSPSTWRSVGGGGLPSQASSGEQLYRAKLLYKRGGAGQWGCGRHLFD
jgi:uncharacterized protein YabE (DUF348 family)